ncbi:universal stress protein [Actinacidiphila bryophytorum]|uniref:universal stress protein n=1 Tax=Actinacidiphila bryophytorum TaxID=1436133 RepID=UPI002176B995|nr:universal stress protein [Actinacidiphila bryophytorum]UWE10535.1 universal stress protein [Actinacidiphila bryophytorum]
MARIVAVGVDGSPESAAAAEWAGDEAAASGAGVRLLGVWQPPASNVQFSPAPEALRQWQEAQVLDAARKLTARHPGLKVTAEQITGSPAPALLDAAATADVTVLGSRALGSVAGFLYGSVGLHVVARSDKPVVLVRAPGSEPGSAGTPVVLALDLDRPSDALTQFAFEEASARGAALHVVHVWDVHRLYGYAGPMLDREIAEQLRSEQAERLAQLLTPWRARFGDVEVSHEVVAGPVTGTLVEAAQEASLLVVGRRRRLVPVGTHIGPVTHAVVHHAPCPVAVVAHD